MLVAAGGTWRQAGTSVAEAMPTRTTRETDALLVPVEGRDGKQAQHAWTPMRTMTTRSETGVLVRYYGNGTPRSTQGPHGTATAASKCVSPGMPSPRQQPAIRSPRLPNPSAKR